MLNEFTINYRGVKITPQLEHQPMRDVLRYRYCEYDVSVTFDFTMYDSSIKNAYIENVKYMARQGLNELRARNINEWYDNMGVK